MILFSMGLPGRFAEWCDAAMARLVGQSGGGVLSRTWPPLTEMFDYEGASSTLDEVARVLIRKSASHLVIGARQPDDRLRNALAERNTRFLVVLDDPRNAVAEILAETGADPKMVVRAVANSCPLVMQYDGLPGALTLHADCVRIDPAAAVSAIAAHFGLAVEPAAIDSILTELAALGTWASPPRGEELAERLPAGLAKMLDGALLAYRNRFLDGHLGQIIWTRELFLIADAGRTPTEPLDLAGGCRDLIYGPYIHLPAGSWTAQAVLGFSREAVGSTILVDAFAASAQLACATLQPDASGIYSVDLNFSVGQPSGKGVEIRVIVASDKAEGQLAFGHVVLRPSAMRQSDLASPEGNDFARVLAL